MPLYDACGRRLSVALIEGAVVRGHAEEIKDAIRNGLENALWHGEGEVRLRLHRSENGFVLDICDEGDGIPPAHREAVFERFRKGAAVSAGSGLGLAIVRRVMHNAGGSAAFVSVRPCVLRLCFVAV
nr:HAMP domain-containing sensor histidine kinase [Bordetella trematum]